MKKPLILSLLAASSLSLFAEELDALSNAVKPELKQTKLANFKSFTGKILGNHVRLRSEADVESAIVKELKKDEMIVVVGEKNDFYAIAPLAGTKAFIFRSFVLDGKVEGNRVNVRLSPDLEAPVIGHMSTGDQVNGDISEQNSKWLEIEPPSMTQFYVAKEYVDYAGGPELKNIHDKKLATVTKLLESAKLLTQSEMRKSFEEIDYARICTSFESIIADYNDFPDFVKDAESSLGVVQETYLKRKLAYLESRANLMQKGISHQPVQEPELSKEPTASTYSPTDRMKVWEPVEQGLFLTWSSMHNAKNMKDFYSNQKDQSVVVSGLLDSYTDPIKNKPGDYIIREKDVPIAYVYSTHVNLHKYLGKQVNLVAAPRPNNNFAFPAYYVLDVE